MIRPRLLLYLIFLLSGAVGLLYQVLWTRFFTFILGSTLEGVSVVIACFLLGLAIGSMFFGRLVDRSSLPLRFYGKLELAGALISGVSFLAFRYLEPHSGWLWSVLPAAGARIILLLAAAILIMLPIACLGGTLPALSRHLYLVGGGGSRSIGLLYGLHTLGAAFGAYAGGMFLVPTWGYSTSVLIAVFVHFAIGCLALFVARSTKPMSAAQETAPTLGSNSPGGMLIAVAMGVIGFSALGFEVVWFRLAEFSFYGTIKGFAAVLFAYLFGHAIGAFLGRTNPPAAGTFRRSVIVLPLALALVGIACLPVLTLLSEFFPGQLSQGAVLICLIMLATALSGAMFSAVVAHVVTSTSHIGLRVGTLYTSSTVGCVLGAVITGFIILPYLGSASASCILGSLNIIASILILLVYSVNVKRSLVVGCALAFALACHLTLNEDWLARLHGGSDRIIASAESRLAILHVRESQYGDRTLTSGPFISGSSMFLRRYTQKHQGHLAMLLHSNPADVLQIGYGVGEISKAILNYHPNQLDLVEIDDKMLPLAHLYFSDLNSRAAEDRSVRLSITDGRTFLRTTSQFYDIVMTDTMEPVSEGSLRLYTAEHFAAGRSRLKPGGYMVLWFPLYAGSERSEIVIRTFLETFPETLAWISPINFELYLFGFRDRIRIDEAEFRKRFEQFGRAELEPFGYRSAESLLGGFRDIKNLGQALNRIGSRINSDWVPILDFVGPDNPDRIVRQILGAPVLNPEWDKYRQVELSLFQLLRENSAKSMSVFSLPTNEGVMAEIDTLWQMAPDHVVTSALLAKSKLHNPGAIR